jgi:hypothetical protein
MSTRRQSNSNRLERLGGEFGGHYQVSEETVAKQRHCASVLFMGMTIPPSLEASEQAVFRQ